MIITTEEAEQLATVHDWTAEDEQTSTGLRAGAKMTAAALRSLAAERDALQAENARLREALHEIERSHIPDQPAAFEHSDLDWARLHVGKLRSIARVALGEKE
jgi:hypothetical protein